MRSASNVFGREGLGREHANAAENVETGLHLPSSGRDATIVGGAVCCAASTALLSVRGVLLVPVLSWWYPAQDDLGNICRFTRAR
jgi:hypothetical protein